MRNLLAECFELRGFYLDRRNPERKRMIRLYLCCFLARAKISISRRALRPTFECPTLHRAVPVHPLRPLVLRALRRAILPASIARPANRELRATPAALSEVALHAVRASIVVFWTCAPGTRILTASVTPRPAPCELTEGTEL